MKIVVLGGGISLERDVSLRSAASVTSALRTCGFEVSQLDPAADGWQGNIRSDSIVFPILHGLGGEDGLIQKELERLGIPYLGTTSEPSKICFDKWLTRLQLEKNNMPVAFGEHVTKDSYDISSLRQHPHVLKAVDGGSSIGTYIVRSPAEIDSSKVAGVFELNEWAVIEELVDGTEVTVPILDNDPLPVIEIIPPPNGEFDYENKYNGQTQEICPAVSIDKTIQANVQQIALDAHKLLGCRHLSRVDIIVKPDGNPVILEINTIPGMTDQSLYPKAAETAGITFPELTSRFVQLVKRDYGL